MTDQAKRTIRVRVDNPHGDLRLDDLLEELGRLKTAFRETERSLFGKEQDIYLKVTSMKKQSPADIVLEAVSPNEDRAVLVTRTFTTGLRAISRNKRLPRGVDVPALKSYRDLAFAATEKRKLGVAIHYHNHEVPLDRKLIDNIDLIMGTDQRMLGSISGTLEVLNLHGGNRKFWLFPVVGPARVAGIFKRTLRNKFAAAMDRYVTVHGEIKYKTWDNYPYEIHADDIDVHDESITLADLRGVAPDATGEMTSCEFVAALRDEE